MYSMKKTQMNTAEKSKRKHQSRLIVPVLMIITAVVMVLLLRTPGQVTLTFDATGGQPISAFTLDRNHVISDPLPVPDRTGYTFLGWYIDQDHEQAFDPQSPILHDLTLYAKWAVNTYTITFESNGGSIIPAITQDYETSIDAPDHPIKTGYVFGGWFQDADLTDMYELTIMPPEDMIVYAKWDMIHYAIDYELDGGVNHPDNPTSRTIAGDIVLDEPIKEGHTFMGWFDNAAFGGDAMMTIEAGTTDDITLYATWSINTYNVTYHMVSDDIQPSLVPLYPGESIIQVALADYHSAVLTSHGRLFTFGVNDVGQLGDGTTIDRYVPVDITIGFNLQAGETIVMVSLGNTHAAALTSEGRLFTWGANWYGQLGDGTTINRHTPADITAHFMLDVGETLIMIFLRGYHAAALTSEGRLFTWGANWYGQLGDGTTENTHTPVDITAAFNLLAGETLIQMSLGLEHSAALTSENRFFTWGRNNSGQLGDGTTVDRHTPVDITDNFLLGGDETLIQMSLGGAHSAALTSEGRLFTWGSNWSFELGDGTDTDRFFPTEITEEFNLPVGETIIQVSLGLTHSSAVTSESRVFTWGYNGHGRLGQGDATYEARGIPTDITSGYELGDDDMMMTVVCGGQHSAFLTTEGRVFTWGYNFYGQLGDGTDVDKYVPTEPLLDDPELSQTQTFEYGAIIMLDTLTIEGYTFSGWYTDPDLMQPYELSTMPAEDLVLYGFWDPTDD